MMNRSDLSFFLEQNDLRPIKQPPRLISDYIQGRRVLPQDSPFPGPIDLQKAPFGIEIMDCFSPYSPVTNVAFKKGVQLTATTIAENVIGFYMGACPAPIIILSATDKLIDYWMDKRIDPLIDSLDLRKLMVSNVQGNKKSRKTGDKARSKTFSGGWLATASAQSPNDLRSQSSRILILDEIDGAPRQLTTGEGNFVSVVEGRTDAWGPKKKIFYLSTPGGDTDSAISIQYEKGDKCLYHVPCPYCGELQALFFGGDKKMYGLKPVFDEFNNLKRVYYECKHCHGEIENHHKTKMLSGGKWIPTNENANPLFRSFHLSSLYSPVGMLSWKQFYQKYLDAKNDPDGMRSFTNLYLGEPYKAKGARPKLKNVIELAGDYKSGTIPHGVLFLTAAIDVQSGKNSRIEMEIRGHGRWWRSWSISYNVFHGAIDNPMTGAWLKLAEFANDGGMMVGGMPVKMIFIDSGDGTGTDTVYQVCKRMTDTFPIKGTGVIKKDRKKTGDAIDTHNFWPWRASKIDEETTLVNISTNHYKNNIYSNLDNSYIHLLKMRDQELPDFDQSNDEERLASRPAGFCDFPLEYGEKYFSMLTAEERMDDGSYHSGGRRNEALDLAVYNSAAADFFLNRLVRRLRDDLKARGVSDVDLDKVNTPFALDFLERNPS
jgi:phage terminase large subunit GpA-like protein